MKEKLGGEGGAKTEKKDEIGKKRKGGTWLFPFRLSRLAFRERALPFLQLKRRYGSGGLSKICAPKLTEPACGQRG